MWIVDGLSVSGIRGYDSTVVEIPRQPLSGRRPVNSAPRREDDMKITVKKVERIEATRPHVTADPPAGAA